MPRARPISGQCHCQWDRPAAAAVAGNAELEGQIYHDLYKRNLEASIIPLCTARDVLWKMQMDGEHVPASAKPDELDYGWLAARNAFEIEDDGEPILRL